MAVLVVASENAMSARPTAGGARGVLRQSPGLSGQRRGGAALNGHSTGNRPGPGAGRRGRGRFGGGGLPHHDVAVRAAHPERADPGDEWLVLPRPALKLGRAAQVQVGQLDRGVLRRKWRLGGIRRWRTARAALIRPAMPAAPSRWPMLVLTEPRTQRLEAGRAPGGQAAEGGRLDRGRRLGCRCRVARRTGLPRARRRRAQACDDRLLPRGGHGQPVGAAVLLTAVPDHGSRIGRRGGARSPAASGRPARRPRRARSRRPGRRKSRSGRRADRARPSGRRRPSRPRRMRFDGGGDGDVGLAARRLPQATWTATARGAARVDRQARPAQVEEVRDPVGAMPPSCAGHALRIQHVDGPASEPGVLVSHAPDKDADRRPGNGLGTCPPSSNASQASSRHSRCCGSQWAASRGDIPKKGASNISTPSTNAPRRTPRSRWASPASMSDQRPSGTAVTASRRRPAAARRRLRPRRHGKPAGHPDDGNGACGGLAARASIVGLAHPTCPLVPSHNAALSRTADPRPSAAPRRDEGLHGVLLAGLSDLHDP